MHKDLIYNLVGPDVKLMRDRYDEALKLRGIECVYMYPNIVDTNEQGEAIVDQYSLPIETQIFFEGSPKIKTFKRLGWVVENDENLPFLVHCSFHLPKVQRDSVFKISGQYTDLPERVFKVTEISYDIQSPDHIICQVIPIYDKQIVGRTKEEVKRTFNTSEHFIKQPVDYRGNYMDTGAKYRRTRKTFSFYGDIVGVQQGSLMLRVKNSNIELTRGDSAKFVLDILLEDGTHYQRVEGDQVKLSVKKSTEATNSLIIKIVEGFEVEFEPEDTESLAYGMYWYDVELTTVDGDVYTVIGPSRFIILEEVTF